VARAIADVYLDALGAPAPEPDRRANDNRPRESATPAKLPLGRLAAFAGTYYSPELETVYRLSVVDDALVAHHQRHPDINLTYAGGDLFTGEMWFFQRLTFTRSGGAVDGFRLTGGRVRNLRFVRLGDGVLAES
jgi:hypothetical protein